MLRSNDGKFAKKSWVATLFVILMVAGFFTLLVRELTVGPVEAQVVAEDDMPLCTKVAEGRYSCTPTSTLLKLARDYPNGVTWVNEYDTLTVEQKIRRIAKEQNFQAADYLVALAKCESRLDPLAHNYRGNKPNGSLDRGLFMLNDHWQKQVTNGQAYSLEWSTRWTINKLKAGQAKLWACDRLIDKSLHRK